MGNPPVTKIHDIRGHPEQIPLEFAIADATERLEELVDNGVIDLVTKETLLGAMEAQYKRGAKLIGLFDYAGLFVNLLAASGHRGRSALEENTTETGVD